MSDPNCKVLSGPFSIVVQVILFTLVITTLVFKKLRENSLGSSRTWREFMLDGSKQLFGSGWVHILNIICAQGLEARLNTGDECAWYWVNIVIDCTLGVLTAKLWLDLGLLIIRKVFSEEQASHFQPGKYYDSPLLEEAVPKFNVYKYIKQLIMWLIVVSLMKLCMVLVMLLLCVPLGTIAAFFLGFVSDYPKAELIVVMIITPICMNALQFWLFDNFLKKKEKLNDASYAAV